MLPIDHTLALSFLNWRTEAVLDQERAIAKARRYYDGEQVTFLTDRLRAFLNAKGDDIDFCMNVCQVIVQALAERVIVSGFDVANPELKDWAETVWKASRMDAVSDDVHEQALRDGESFVLIDWLVPDGADTTAGRLKFISHPRYVDVGADGDGFGIYMVYPDDDVSADPEFAVKRWIEYGDDARNLPTQRATFYYPDRIEKRRYTGPSWEPVKDDLGEPWPIPWVDATGKPLGIPVIHFKNKGLKSEAWQAIPLQDLINKTLIDMAASADMAGLPFFFAAGFIPTSDGKAGNGTNSLVIEPGQIIGTTAASTTVEFKAIPGADLTPMLDMIQKLLVDVAMITGTPAGRFQVTGQIAGSETLKEQETPLLSKARKRQIVFGDAWEDLLTTARRMANYFGGMGLDETVAFETLWVEAATRSEEDKRAEGEFKKAMGIPTRQIWSEMGYSAAKIDEMLNDPEVINGTWSNYPAAGSLDTAVPSATGDTAAPIAPTAASADTGAIQQVALNGAQVAAAIDIVIQVTAGTLSHESGLASLQILFGLTEEQARQMLPASLADNARRAALAQQKVGIGNGNGVDA